MTRNAALLSTMLVVALLIPAAAAAQGRCFPETNVCMSGRFEKFWERNGGLPVFGYPISLRRSQLNVDTGKAYPTQLFERNRFELHADQLPPYDVLLGRLGVARLAALGRDWTTFPKARPETPHFFAETGHAIGHVPFWNYWSKHGLNIDGTPGFSYAESLALFGYPISEPQMETNASGDTVLTQWFERARFEDHGAKGVLLGLLGSELSEPQSTPEAEIAMGVNDFGYERPSIQTTLGGTVTWRFVGPSIHRLVDGTGLNLYDSGPQEPGASFTWTFSSAGSFEYRCSLHPEMLGIVRVSPIASATIGARDDDFLITWASTPAPDGYVYDIQIKRPGDATFEYWLTGQTGRGASFTADRGAGTYTFRARLRSLSSNRDSQYSPLLSISVI
jgi:plastocyanin